ncbi:MULTISPECIES: hypothetical protein [Klebsiella]|uniref:hypothetical protein n=1 Tax=Klebsiella TaxID=570 RepID=UPI00148717E2|nr:MULTISPECIES: hypothetical protein [Klebsiella]
MNRFESYWPRCEAAKPGGQITQKVRQTRISTPQYSSLLAVLMDEASYAAIHSPTD